MTFDKLMDDINILDQERRYKRMQANCDYIATKEIREQLRGEVKVIEAEIYQLILNFIKGER